MFHLTVHVLRELTLSDINKKLLTVPTHNLHSIFKLISCGYYLHYNIILLEAQLHHKQQLLGLSEGTHWVPFTINKLTETMSAVIYNLFVRQQTVRTDVSHKWVTGLQKVK